MYITNLDTIKSAEVPQTGKAGIPISEMAFGRTGGST